MGQAHDRRTGVCQEGALCLSSHSASSHTFCGQKNFDVFNALDVMENSSFLSSLKFGVGDGNLQYYLYNYRSPELEPSDVGLVLM